MRYLTAYLNVTLLTALSTVCWGAAIDDCMVQGKKQFAARNYLAAQDTFTRCMKLDARNVDARLSLAGVLLTQDDLSGADKQFRAAK